MKKLLFLFLFLPFIGKAQLYHVMPQYGYQMQRADVQYVLKVPSDTTTNKTGVARIGTTLYAGNGTYWTAMVNGALTMPISSLTAAAATNTINNANYGQEWQWNSLTATGMTVSTTTTASLPGSVLLSVVRSGANAAANRTTYALSVANTHTGTNSVNYGLLSQATLGVTTRAGGFISSGTGTAYGVHSSSQGTGTNIAGQFGSTGGTSNYAIIVPASSGSVGIGTSAPDSLLTVEEGIYGKRGVRFSGLPSGVGTKAVRIDGNGVLSTADTTVGGGGSLTSTYIGYGSAGNALTGDANLTYTAASSAVVIDSGYLSFTGHKSYGSTVTGSIFKHADYGLTTRAVTGSTYDWLMFSTGGNTILANPTGTDNFLTSGKWGFGSLGLTPTAKVQIAAGSATANTAPLQLTTGPVETVARAGVMEYTTPQLFFTNGAAVRQELFQGQQSRVSTQYDNTTTTLGNVTGLTANVAAGKIYRFEAKLYTTSDVAGGIKVAIGGTATATSIRYEGLTTDAGLTTQSRSATLGTAVGAVTAVTAAYVTITGTITVNAAGTLTVQAAANAATGTTSVLTGSTFVITEML